jgi:UDPglucose 6-dehydrogenase
MRISVIGTGYVGLVTGTCFAETGNDVTCIDNDAGKIEALAKNGIPFYEPGLRELVERNRREGRLSFTTDLKRSVSEAEVAFVCVGTPSSADGSADLSFVREVAKSVAESGGNPVLTIKSTVPVGTGDEVSALLKQMGKENLRVASNPEFLREGSAVQDCLTPDRIVIGTEDPAVAGLFRELYAPYVRTGKPIYVMDVRSAEMTKYAANALLAQRISFMNEISMLCDLVGADISLVRSGIAADHRIGSQYLFPSVGFGGSCFPKDVRALASLCEKNGLEPKLLKATLDVNEAQKSSFVSKVLKHFGGKEKARGKKIAVWGLAFKAKTDDVRESPALTVIDGLLNAKMNVTVYDPVANPNVQTMYRDQLTYASTAYGCLEGADAVCVLTEWNQFRTPDFVRMKKQLAEPVVFDGRNLYDPGTMQTLGFTYYSIGRPIVRSARTRT